MNVFKSIGQWFKEEFEKGGKATTIVEEVDMAVTVVEPMLTGALAIIDPAVNAEVTPIANKVVADLNTLNTLVQTNASDPTIPAKLASLEAETGSILDLASVKNSAKRAKIAAIVQFVIAEIQALTPKSA
jgi:predicted aldo/keto reductase-like oxidoreductase